MISRAQRIPVGPAYSHWIIGLMPIDIDTGTSSISPLMII